jgi:BolA protein
MVGDTPERIENILRERLEPLHFELRDDSAEHIGHPGAKSGGGHYHVFIVSAAFEGQSRIEQHRMVNAALQEMFGQEIHALGLNTLAPCEWNRGPLRGPQSKNRP